MSVSTSSVSVGVSTGLRSGTVAVISPVTVSNVTGCLNAGLARRLLTLGRLGRRARFDLVVVGGLVVFGVVHRRQIVAQPELVGQQLGDERVRIVLTQRDERAMQALPFGQRPRIAAEQILRDDARLRRLAFAQI